MAFKVTTNYHTIYPPTQLTEKLAQLSTEGAIAKILKQDKLYNDLKNAYIDLKNQWESSAKRECEQKSKTNWLGGGDIYASYPCPDWDSAIKPLVMGLNDWDRQTLIKMLNDSIIKINNR